MITGPEGHGLHVILPRDLIRDLSTSSFNLHRLRYELFITPLLQPHLPRTDSATNQH